MASAQRVLIVSEHPYPDHATVRRNVAQLLDCGIAVDVVCLAGRHGGHAEAPDAASPHLFQLHMQHRRSGPYRYFQEYAGFWLWSFFVVLGLSIRHRYDAVLIDNPPDFLVFVPVLARLRGARIVLEMFELVPELTVARMKLRPDHPAVRLIRWIEGMAARRASGIIAVSQQCRDILVARGVDPRKISIVPNTIPALGTIVAPAGGPARGEFIVTHCSLVERYGVQVAIRALALLREKRPGLRLEVLGEGEYKASLVALAAELGLEQSVDFRGFLPWGEAMAEIRQAAVGIVAIVADGYGELLLPTKLLEYADNEVPVACANLPTIAHNFPADALAYFEPGDASGLANQVDRLLDDRPAAREQATRAKAAMSRMSWEAIAPRYMAALGLEQRRPVPGVPVSARG